MRLYWELARRGYRRYAAYPAATWAGVFTNTAFGCIVDHGRVIWDGTVPELVRRYGEERTLVVDLSIEEPDIEEIVRRIYEGR